MIIKQPDNIIQEYFAKFDDTINFVLYPESIKEKAIVEMKKVLNGDRKPLTDVEFGQAIPIGVTS